MPANEHAFLHHLFDYIWCILVGKPIGKILDPENRIKSHCIEVDHFIGMPCGLNSCDFPTEGCRENIDFPHRHCDRVV